tara:strand:- start:192 stop:2387 length:2196 start_codon:yes stop_codon:yes gene_type:complete
MTIKYLDSKRISALSSDGEGLTFSDDFSTDDWTTSSSSVIGVSGGVLNWSVPNGSVQEQQSYVDMLGSLINTTQWSIRFKLTVSGYVQGSSAQTQQLFFGISNESSSGHTNTQDIIGLKLTLTNTISTIGVQMKNATPSNTGNTSNVSTALSAGTWYVEINRLNLTQSKITLYSDSSYSQWVSTATETYSTNALNDLRYLKCSEYSNNAGTDHTLSGTIDDVSFYNGLTSIVKPTNVQDNSILVEKDTGKRYWFDDAFDLSELKSYWKFNEASGDIVNQAISVGSTDGLGTTASNLQIAGATYDQTGITANNKSLYFDGSDHGQSGTSTSQFNFLHTPNTKWTINFWLKYGGDTTANTILDTNGGGGTARVGLLIDILTDEGLEVWMGRGVPLTTVITTTTSASFVPSDSAFHFYSIRYDHTLASSNVKISIDNGTPVTGNKTSDTPSSADSAFPFNIAENCNGYGAFLDGNLTEMSIWNRVLTDAEVTTIYNSGSGKTLDTAKGATWTYEYALPTISGLKLHLDASDATTITKDSSNLVSAWNDKSGEGNHISQATASKQPLWVGNTQNGLPLIRFDGTDDQLNRSTFVNGAISQGFYMFVVMKPTVGTASNPYNFDGGASARGWCYTDSSDVVRYGSATEQIIDSNLPSTPVMYTFFVNGSSSNVRKNSVSTTSATLGSTSSNGLWLACRHNDTSFGSPDHAEFLFYDNDIGTTNRDAVERYLKKKWGL